jgi:hypothetical protein
VVPGAVRVGAVLRIDAATTRAAARGRMQYIALAPRALALEEQCRREQKERDRDIDHMSSRLRDLDIADAPVALASSITTILERHRPSARGIAGLVADWERHNSWRPDLRAEFQKWLKDNNRLWHHITNNRRHITNLRRQHYRAEAKRILADAKEIVINKHDMAKTARAGQNGLPVPVRRVRFLAAPSELRAAILGLARREGIRLRMLSLANNRCATCGMPIPAATGHHTRNLIWKCPSGHVLDQDENYCRLMLQECERLDGVKNTAR